MIMSQNGIEKWVAMHTSPGLKAVPDFPEPLALSRLAWVLGELKLSGRSFASIAREQGVGKTAVRQALYQPSLAMELAIAQAIGVDPVALFPERYLSNGERLHARRGPRRRRASDHARESVQVNVNPATAA